MARLKIRQIVFIGLIAGSVIMLILALSGLFRPGDFARSGSARPDKPGQLVVEKPLSQGPDWTMSADKAIINPSEEMLFIKPVVKYAQKPADGGAPRTVRITADEGRSMSGDARSVLLTGNVVARMNRFADAAADAPESSGTLRTDSLVWKGDVGQTEAPGRVDVRYVEEGRAYRLSGEAFWADVHNHAIRLERGAKLVLDGDVGLMAGAALPAQSAGPSADEKPATTEPPGQTVVTCEGPLLADETSGNVTLEKNVQVKRGDQTLRSDRMVVHVGKGADGRTAVDHWQAQGNVRLTGGNIEMKGSRLLRAADGLMTLIGNSPCTVTAEGMVIEAESVSMELETGRVSVPSAGKLTMTPKPAPAAADQPPPAVEPKPTTATWSGGMTFDKNEGKAVLTKDVHVVGENIDISSDRLTLWLSEDRSQLEKLLAEGDVRMVTPQAVVTGNRILYLMKEQRLELEGEPAATIEEQDHMIASKVIRMDRASGDLACSEAGNLTTTIAGNDAPGGKRQATITWGKAMNLSQKDGVGHFEGDVAMKDGVRELRSDTMNMQITSGQKRELQSIDAVGEVRLNWEGRVGFGDKFRWEADGGKGYLLGAPARVAYPQGWLKGNDIQFKNNFNEVTVRGATPVEASLERGQSAGAEQPF